LTIANQEQLVAAIGMDVPPQMEERLTSLPASSNNPPGDDGVVSARAMNCTLFVQIAPCFASLGVGGPSYLSHSIATPTGEGVSTPMTFTRQRRMVTGGGALRIV
jgi:hypothetical protein